MISSLSLELYATSSPDLKSFLLFTAYFRIVRDCCNIVLVQCADCLYEVKDLLNT